MLEKLKSLEAQARVLDPDAGARETFRDAAVAHGEQFLEKMDGLPAYLLTADKGAALLDSPIGEAGISMEEALDLLAYNVDRHRVPDSV